MIDKSQIEVGIPKIASADELRGYGNYEGVFSNLFFISDLNKNFKYDPTDTTSADDGTDVIVNSITGRRYKNVVDANIPVAISDRLPFSTISSLKSKQSIFDEVYVTDLGKEGVFRYDSSDSTSSGDDVFIIVSGSKRYKRVYNGAFNLDWFGAKGDGATDDSIAFDKAITYLCNNGGTLYISPKVYHIALDKEFTVSSGVKSISIISNKGTLKGTKSNNILNIVGHAECDFLFDGIVFNGTRNSSLLDYAKVSQIYKQDNARVRNAKVGYTLNGFRNCTTKNCEFIDIHGVGFVLRNGESAIIDKNHFQELTRQGAQVYHTVLHLTVTDNKFKNIGILPTTFKVDDVTYQFNDDASGKVWFTDNGDGINYWGKQMIAYGNEFVNINRMPFCMDAIHDPTIEMEFRVFANTHVSDHERLRCSNPQAFLWVENGKKGHIHDNTIIYRKRDAQDLAGTAIVLAVTHREDCLFEVYNNTILTEGFNIFNMNAISSKNINGSVIIRDNTIKGVFYSCIYHNNTTKGSFNTVLEQYIISGNVLENNNEQDNSSTIVFDSSSIDGFHMKRLYVKSNIIRQPYGKRPSVYAYAKELNLIQLNDLGGTDIDLQFSDYPEKNLYIEHNKNVGLLGSRNGSAGATSYMTIRDNCFLGNLYASSIGGVNRISGSIINNTINGFLFIRSATNLIISSNYIENGIVFNNPSQSSWGVVISNNIVLTNESNKSAVFFNNFATSTYTNTTIGGNVFSVRAGETDATFGIKYAIAGEQTLALGQNRYMNITTSIDGAGILPHVRGKQNINLPLIAAGETYTGTASLTGSKVGHIVQITPNGSLGGLSLPTGYVSSDGTITYTVSNPTSSDIDLPSISITFNLT